MLKFFVIGAHYYFKYYNAYVCINVYIYMYDLHVFKKFSHLCIGRHYLCKKNPLHPLNLNFGKVSALAVLDLIFK